MLQLTHRPNRQPQRKLPPATFRVAKSLALRSAARTELKSASSKTSSSTAKPAAWLIPSWKQPATAAMSLAPVVPRRQPPPRPRPARQSRCRGRRSSPLQNLVFTPHASSVNESTMRRCTTTHASRNTAALSISAVSIPTTVCSRASASARRSVSVRPARALV